jgi:hypothetical protein
MKIKPFTLKQPTPIQKALTRHAVKEQAARDLARMGPRQRAIAVRIADIQLRLDKAQALQAARAELALRRLGDLEADRVWLQINKPDSATLIRLTKFLETA